MRITALVLAALALTPAVAQAAVSPCDTDAGLEESLCRADRPLVSIRMSAASPRAGAVIPIEAHSDGRRLTYAWDLDGDGFFDDAQGASTSRAFKSGQRSIAVRATDQFGRTSTESRSFLVHAFNAYPMVDLDVGAGTVGVGEPLTISTYAYDPDGAPPWQVELDLDGDGSYDKLIGSEWTDREVTFSTPGTHVIGVKATDDGGDPTWATAPVQVVAPAPGVALNVAGEPVLAGEPTAVEATALGFNATRYQFDLDGDGTYETDRGAQPTATATFTAGEREIGVRATGAGKDVSTRMSVFVAASASTTTPWGRFTSEPRAHTGVPARVSLELFPAGTPYTVIFDSDGDGAFDDGMFSGAGEAWGGFLAQAAGVYDVRAKLTSQAGVSRVEHMTITVSDSGATGPRFPSLIVGPARAVGQPRLIEPTAESGTTLTFDLDGDGQFDETPAHDQYGYHWAFDEPVVFAVKATDAAGRSSVRTQLVAPLTGNLGPQTSLYFQRQAFPTPEQLLEPRLLAGHTTTAFYELLHEGEPCCTMRWDTDGDGAYDDATGGFPPFTAQAREYTFGAMVEDGAGAYGAVRDTFSIGTLPPRAAFTSDGPNVLAKATDADGDAITSLEWDLDGDRAFDDATGSSARALVGRHLVGLKATDAGGDVGIDYAWIVGTPVDGGFMLDPPQFVPPPPPPPPAKPLALRLALSKVKLGALLSRGLAVKPGCELACRATVAIAVDKRTAKRLKLRSPELGHASGTGTTIKVKLGAEARKALAKVRSVKFTVAVIAAGADGRIGTAHRVLTVRR